jgi:broad specificity phosphatase PhoE
MKTLLFLTLIALTSVAYSMPSKIILIRHGEEPLGNEGAELSKIGWKRAEALPQLFKNEKITDLIALRPHKKKGSIRSIQTLQPLSGTVGLEIKTPYTREEVSDLVQMLSDDHRYDGKVVLIAWQHETLADIAHELGAHQAPAAWGKYFDRYWVLEFKGQKIKSFKNLPQRLLAGDSKE